MKKTETASKWRLSNMQEVIAFSCGKNIIDSDCEQECGKPRKNVKDSNVIQFTDGTAVASDVGMFGSSVVFWVYS